MKRDRDTIKILPHQVSGHNPKLSDWFDLLGSMSIN